MQLKTAVFLTCATFATGTLALADPAASPAPAPASAPAASPAAAPVPIVSPSGPPPSDAISKTITAQYALTCAATLDPTDANLDKSFGTLAPEFVNIDTKGNQLKRDEVIANAKQQLKTFHGTNCDNSLDSMTATDPNTVVVVDTQKVTGDIQAPDGKHDIDVLGKSQDTWKNQNGAWLETQSQDIHIVVKIDGNVVQDMGGR